jgi:hypothetical protein
MSIEFIGMIHHREASEIKAPPPLVLDRGYIRDFAQGAEAGGFDKVLVGYFSDGPDGSWSPPRPRRIPRNWASWSPTAPASSPPPWRRGNSPRSTRSPAAGRPSMSSAAATIPTSSATATRWATMSAMPAPTNMSAS